MKQAVHIWCHRRRFGVRNRSENKTDKTDNTQKADALKGAPHRHHASARCTSAPAPCISTMHQCTSTMHQHDAPARCTSTMHHHSPPDSTTDKIQPRKDENPLVLSTIHSAKGLEWRNVYVLNVIEGCIPYLNAESAGEIEEERRLLHVAMTRAKNRLELTLPRQVYRSRHGKRGNQSAFTKLTRFIPQSIRGSFDCRHQGEKAPVAPQLNKPGPRVNMFKRRRGIP